jgi:hypothetical protein
MEWLFDLLGQPPDYDDGGAIKIAYWIKWWDFYTL